MRKIASLALVSVVALGGFVAAQPKARHNKVIGLLEAKQPVFGLYAPSNRRFPGPPGSAPATPPPPQKSPAELAQEAAAYKLSDFVFDGSFKLYDELTANEGNEALARAGHRGPGMRSRFRPGWAGAAGHEGAR